MEEEEEEEEEEEVEESDEEEELEDGIQSVDSLSRYCTLCISVLYNSSLHHQLYLLLLTLFPKLIYMINLFNLILFCSTPTGVETPDVIDLRKQQRKEPEKPLYQVSNE